VRQCVVFFSFIGNYHNTIRFLFYFIFYFGWRDVAHRNRNRTVNYSVRQRKCKSDAKIPKKNFFRSFFFIFLSSRPPIIMIFLVYGFLIFFLALDATASVLLIHAR